MKKFYLLLVAMLVGFAANAGTIYLVGGGTVDGKSLPGSPNGNCVAVTSTTNVYTFTVSNISWLKISDTNATDWATFNKNGFTIDGKGDYALSATDLGKTFKLWYSNGSSEGTNNINPPSKDEYIYTLTVNGKGTSNSTLVVKAAGDVEIKYDIYLRGSMNNYGAEAKYKFTTTDQKNFTLAGVTLPKDTQFKIADADWGAINYGYASTVEPNVAYTLGYNADNMTLGTAITNATINFNLETAVMKIVDESVVTPDPISYTIYFDNTDKWEDVYVWGWGALGGQFSGINYPGIQLQKNDEGLYVWSFETVTEIPETLGTNDGFQFNNGKGSTENGEKKTGDIKNFENGATYYPNGTTTPPSTEIPMTLYIKGEVNEWEGGEDWVITRGESTNDNGEYVYTGTFASLSGLFKINESLGAAVWSGINYGSISEGEAVVIATGETIEAVDNGNNFECAEEYTNLTVNFYYNPDGQSWLQFEEQETPEPVITYVLAGPIFLSTDQMEMTVEDNIATVTATVQKQVYTIKKLSDGEVATVYGPEGAGDVTTALGTAYQAVEGATAQWVFGGDQIPDATRELTFTFDLTTLELTVTAPDEEEPEPDPGYGDNIDVTFNFTSYDDLATYVENLPALDQWNAGSAAGQYTYYVTAFESGHISVTTDAGSTTGSNVPRFYWTGSAMTYRFNKDSYTTITAPQGYKLTEITWAGTTVASTMNKMTVEGNYGSMTDATSSDKSRVWTPGETESYNSITFNAGATLMLTSLNVKAVSINSGVDQVVVEDVNAPVYYYNLQGVRVENPANGLYIRVQGNKVSKEIIK